MDMFYMSPEVSPDDYVPWEEPEDTTMPRPQERAGERGTSLTMKFNSSSFLQIQADRRDCYRTWYTNSNQTMGCQNNRGLVVGLNCKKPERSQTDGKNSVAAVGDSSTQVIEMV